MSEPDENSERWVTVIYLDHICCKVCITLPDSFQYKTHEAPNKLSFFQGFCTVVAPHQDVTPIPTDCTRKKCGRRGRRLWAPVLDRNCRELETKNKEPLGCLHCFSLGGGARDLPKKSPKFFFLCVRQGFFENFRQMEYVKSSSEAFEIHITSPHHWLHPIGSTRAVNPVSSSQRRQNSSVHSQQRNSYVSSLTPPHYPLEPLRL